MLRKCLRSTLQREIRKMEASLVDSRSCCEEHNFAFQEVELMRALCGAWDILRGIRKEAQFRIVISECQTYTRQRSRTQAPPAHRGAQGSFSYRGHAEGIDVGRTATSPTPLLHFLHFERVACALTKRALGSPKAFLAFVSTLLDSLRGMSEGSSVPSPLEGYPPSYAENAIVLATVACRVVVTLAQASLELVIAATSAL